MPAQPDGKYPPYYVMQEDKLLEINQRWVSRDYNMSYPIGPGQWRRFCSDGIHSAFDAKVMTMAWKPSATPVVVVRVPSEVIDDVQDRFIWCVRVRITVAHGEVVDGKVGDRFLWPISPNDSCKLWGTLACSATEHMSRLVTDFRPWRHPLDHQRRLLGSWVDLPGTFEIKAISDARAMRGDHMMCAAVRLAKTRGMKQPDQVARFMTLPTDQLRIARFKPKRSPAGSLVKFLYGDVLDHVLHPLVDTYIHTPNYGALRHWTALRAVSRDFRDSVDSATVRWIDRAAALVRDAMRTRKVAAALALRDFVVPTGIDVLQLITELYQTDDLVLERRQALILYKRLRARKPLGSNPPEPPPRPPEAPVLKTAPAVEVGTRMGMTHGHLNENAARTVPRYNTRLAEQDLSVRVRMICRVPFHLVPYAAVRGWHPAAEPKPPGLDCL